MSLISFLKYYFLHLMSVYFQIRGFLRYHKENVGINKFTFLNDIKSKRTKNKEKLQLKFFFIIEFVLFHSDFIVILSFFTRHFQILWYFKNITLLPKKNISLQYCDIFKKWLISLRLDHYEVGLRPIASMVSTAGFNLPSKALMNWIKFKYLVLIFFFLVNTIID